MNSLTNAALALLSMGVAIAHGPTPNASVQGPRTYAQQLVGQAVAGHADVKSVELAIDSAGVCKTIAATAREDVGEKCDDDELGPMRTAQPEVEEPSTDDPVYDITQALHDASGQLIGAFGMDIAPRPGQARAQVLALAQTVLRELEASIPSKQKVFERLP